MFDSIVQMLDRVGSVVFWTCVAAIVAVDVIAVAAVLRTRSRELVNRWAGPVLSANFLLLGAGLGVPAAAYVVKVAVRAVAPSMQGAAARSQPAEFELQRVK